MLRKIGSAVYMIVVLALGVFLSVNRAHAEQVEVWAWDEVRNIHITTGCYLRFGELDIWVDGVRYPIDKHERKNECSFMGIGPAFPDKLGCNKSVTVNGNTVQTFCWGNPMLTRMTCPRPDEINNYGISITYADGRQKWLNGNCQIHRCSGTSWTKVMTCNPP